MKKISLYSIVLFLVFGSSFVLASSLWCYGTINSAYVSSSGDLVIQGTWRGGWTQICNLDTSASPVGNWKGVSNTVCKDWHSIVQAAVVSQSPVIVYYDADAIDCTTLATYSNTPAPGYIMLRD